MKKQQAGFTLAELLIVIAIIGILASLVLPSLVNALFQGNMVACQSNLTEIYKQVQTYKTSNQTPPPAMGGDKASNWGMFLKGNGRGAGTLNNKLFFCPINPRSGNFNEEDRKKDDGDYMFNVNENGLSPLSSAAGPKTVLMSDCVAPDQSASSHGNPKEKPINILLKNSSIQKAKKGSDMFKRAMNSNMVGGINSGNPSCPKPKSTAAGTQSSSPSGNQQGSGSSTN